MAGQDVYVVDIETVGAPWNSLDEKTREYLLGKARSDGEREAVPQRLGLSPGTGRVIVIGMLNVTTGVGGLIVEGRNKGWVDGGPEGFKRFDGDEKEMLEEFWRIMNSAARRIVTFNGRGFDGPFMMLRSAMLGVRPSLNMAGYRFSLDPHCDLAEVLSFYGATRQSFSLDYWCRRFGITSPKDDGLDGSMVQRYYEDGKLDEIVDYCARDVVATAALYERLEETLVPLLAGRGR